MTRGPVRENPYLDRVAVTAHERGVAIYRGTQRGLRSEVSADGITWAPGEALSGEGQPLWPVCAGDAACGTDLFCADEAGKMVPVRARGGRISVREAFGPAPAAPQWYEADVNVKETVIVRDVRDSSYRVFFCARRKTGRHPERRGCIGTAVSPDLRHWSAEPPIFAPNLYPHLYSPHVFNDEARTVLFYATAVTGGLRALRFAVAPHLDGPYERPEPDLLACDVRGTIHTVKLGSRQLVFFGRWLPGENIFRGISRPGQLDFHPDGRPFVRAYEGLLKLATKTLFRTDVSLSSSGPLVRMLPRHGRDFRLTARLRRLGARSAGLLLRTTITGADNVTVLLEYEKGAITLRRGVRGRVLSRARRPLSSKAVHHLSIWAEGPFADVYLDDEWVLSGYTETRQSGCFGLAVEGGEARFEDVSAQAIDSTTPEAPAR